MNESEKREDNPIKAPSDLNKKIRIFFISPVLFGVSRRVFLQLCLAALLLIVGLALPVDERVKSALLVLSFACSGLDVILIAFERLFTVRCLGEELLVTAACLIAFVVSKWVDGAAVMLLYQFGRTVRAFLSENTQDSFQNKMEYFNREFTTVKGEISETIQAQNIRPGDVLRIPAEEYFPTDCKVLEGSGTVELTPLVGIEHRMIVEPGKTLPAGTKNGGTELLVECIGEYKDSVYIRSLKIASAHDEWTSPMENALQKYARLYAPFAFGLTVLFSLLLLIFTDASTEDAIHRALIFLVVSVCTPFIFPIPLVFQTSKLRTLQKGVLVRNNKVMNDFAEIAAVILDKEELLVTGQYKVVSILSEKMEPDMLLKVAAHACAQSTLPEEMSIVRAYGELIDPSLIDRFAEYESGVAAIINGIQLVIGNREFMQLLGIETDIDTRGCRAVYMALNGQYAGCFLLTDVIREEARSTVLSVESAGCICIMLSSGSPEETKLAAQAAGISVYHSQCMPLDRLEKIHEIKDAYPGGKIMVVGHGGSDDSSLAAADIGATVCGLTSDLAWRSGDAVILDAMPNSLYYAIENGRAVRKKIRNILTANILVKVILLLLSLFGIFSSLWVAVLVDCLLSAAGILYASDFGLKKG